MHLLWAAGRVRVHGRAGLLPRALAGADPDGRARWRAAGVGATEAGSVMHAGCVTFFALVAEMALSAVGCVMRGHDRVPCGSTIICRRCYRTWP